MRVLPYKITLNIQTKPMGYLIGLSLILGWFPSCNPKQQSQYTLSFTLAQDSCFKNTLTPNPNIKVLYGENVAVAYRYPHIPGSKLEEQGPEPLPIRDSIVFLSPDQEVRISSWPKHDYPFPESEKLTYQDLVSFNAYAVAQRMFTQDSTLKIIKNVMYKNCRHPHFVMQGENAQSIYFLKTELSRSAFLEDKELKNFLVQFPKKLKKKYWGTVNQMMEKAGYHVGDTATLRKQVEEFVDKHYDSLKVWIKRGKKK